MTSRNTYWLFYYDHEARGSEWPRLEERHQMMLIVPTMEESKPCCRTAQKYTESTDLSGCPNQYSPLMHSHCISTFERKSKKNPANTTTREEKPGSFLKTMDTRAKVSPSEIMWARVFSPRQLWRIVSAWCSWGWFHVGKSPVHHSPRSDHVLPRLLCGIKLLFCFISFQSLLDMLHVCAMATAGGGWWTASKHEKPETGTQLPQESRFFRWDDYAFLCSDMHSSAFLCILAPLGTSEMISHRTWPCALCSWTLFNIWSTSALGVKHSSGIEQNMDKGQKTVAWWSWQWRE